MTTLPLMDDQEGEGGDAKAPRRGGRPKADTPKVHIGFRLDADLVAAIKATGKGYNGRVEKALRDALARGELDADRDLFGSAKDGAARS